MKKILNDSYEIVSHNLVLEELQKNEYVCCIGFFDLLHSGHQKILNETIKVANDKGLKTICFTFDKKPRDFINNDTNNIWDLKTRVNALEKYNFDYIFKLVVSTNFLETEALVFLNTLKTQFNVKHVVIGNNFRFGAKAKGDFSTLVSFFSADNVSVIKTNGVSTSIIKEYLNKGNIKTVNKLLEKRLMIKAFLNKNLYNLELNSNRLKDGVYDIEVLGNNFTVNIANNSFILDLDEKIDEIEVFFY